MLSEEWREALKHGLLLHDCIEDTRDRPNPITAATLLARGYSEKTVKIVTLLTRPPEDDPNRGTYMDFIKSIIDSGEIAAMIGKLADNDDNSDPERIAQLPLEMQSILNRYERSKRKLRKALKERGVMVQCRWSSFPCG